MKLISILNGNFAKVDDEDFDRLSQFSWYMVGDYVGRSSGSSTSIYMHDDVKICHPRCDHVNGNNLDNQKTNLRSASVFENNRNRDKSKNNTSGYKGVSWNYRARKYQARIMAGGKNIFLGSFKTAIEAAVEYNKAAIVHHKEFAFLNKI